MSTINTRAYKRKRICEFEDDDEDDYNDLELDEPPTVIPVRPVRSASLWLEDGNIIFQAEGKQFKVYRGLLSLQSTIFRDMFTVPQYSAGDSFVEGCPVVHLSDAAADLEFALEAIFLRKYVQTNLQGKHWKLRLMVYTDGSLLQIPYRSKSSVHFFDSVINTRSKLCALKPSSVFSSSSHRTASLSTRYLTRMLVALMLAAL